MYRTVIFDLDGVITSESVFWLSAALTAAEFLGIGSDTPEALRKSLFYEDKLIRLVKNRGVNSNWDLVYLTVAFWETDGRTLYETLSATEMMAFDLYRAAEKRLAEKKKLPCSQTQRGGTIWQAMADSFQEWFLGSEAFQKVYKKPPIGGRDGLWSSEEPIVGRENLISTLRALKEKGVSLRIGTARPLPEGKEPLVRWGAYEYFDDEGAITYDYIKAAEEKTGQKGLGKPHPYIFLKAYFGKSASDADLVSGRYKKDFSDCLVVGDAGADLFAAEAMGADFAAVLTGVQGEEARPFFEKNGAKYILSDITALPQIWK